MQALTMRVFERILRGLTLVCVRGIRYMHIIWAIFQLWIFTRIHCTLTFNVECTVQVQALSWAELSLCNLILWLIHSSGYLDIPGYLSVCQVQLQFSRNLWKKILLGIDGVALYVDDIIVTGANDMEHMKNLERVLKRLNEWNLKVKRNKCTFMQSWVEYLGFKVDKVGIHPTETKIEAIIKAPRKQNVQELHSLCGGISYYRKFLPNLSSIMHPLNQLKGNVDFKLTKECDEAFSKVKQLLSSANVLVHYDPHQNLTMAVDASPYGVSAVISHHCDWTNAERPIAYASCSLTKAERNYSQLEREALAIIFGLQRFHQYIYARKFTQWTDNKPLSLILGSKN